MKRSDFLKTLSLGIAAITTGVAVAKQPEKSVDKPKPPTPKKHRASLGDIVYYEGDTWRVTSICFDETTIRCVNKDKTVVLKDSNIVTMNKTYPG